MDMVLKTIYSVKIVCNIMHIIEVFDILIIYANNELGIDFLVALIALN